MTDPSAKRAVIEELLEQGMVLVTLDATAQGVQVPVHLRDDSQLRLNLSYRFGLPMEVNEDGIDATLTFGGIPYDCRLPWHAMYLVVSHVTGRPVLFPEDVPEELMRLLTEEAAEEDHSSPPKLQVIRGESTEDASSSEADSEQPPSDLPPSRRRAHLRVVK